MSLNRLGLSTTLSAYVLWGVLPLYWKLLRETSSVEIICHRIVWSLIFTVLCLALSGGVHPLRASLKSTRTWGRFLCTSLLLGCNWLIYVWAINNGYVVESSLGYFINPLLAVALGVVVLGERLRPLQWLALLLALGGVLYLALGVGHPPWIGLSLAVTFAAYSLLRKTALLPPLDGLLLEMAILTPPSLVMLAVLSGRGNVSFFHDGYSVTLLLMGSGIITAVPLLLFIYGARRISMTAMGLLQYIAPTLQFFLGLLLYHEPFPREKWIGFGVIWLALVLYSGEYLFFSLFSKNAVKKES